MGRSGGGGPDMADEWTGLDIADEAPGALRDRPPDPLAVPDPDSPVSGHRPAPESTGSPAEAPEHDWAAARALVFPILQVGLLNLVQLKL